MIDSRYLSGEPRDDIGWRVRMTRVEQMVSQRALAARAGISRSYLCDMERGRGADPSRKVVAKLAEALGVPSAFLLGEATPDERSAEIRKVSGDIYRWLSEGHQLVRKLEALGLT
jgi:transcriptional regulator with XRE-family HTH domain